MQKMKKIDCDGAVAKPKGCRIVSWSQEEDDILSNRIRIHGTEKYSFCSFLRGFSSNILVHNCVEVQRQDDQAMQKKAQKVYGNRWTEIAKVVSGRTDNAVKNRFTTLCKKRAKSEAMAKENKTLCMNQNNKRVVFQNTSGTIVPNTKLPDTTPLKKTRRNHVSDLTDNSYKFEVSPKECGEARNKQLRFPLSVLEQNSNSAVNITSHHNAHTKEMFTDEANKVQGTFLKKDDPRIFALLQQEELLSSLAIKVNTENTDQSLENAWKVLQDFLNQAKGTDMLDFGIYDMDFQLEDFKDLIEDLRSSNEGSQTCWRPHELEEDSAGSSEYSTGSTFVLSENADDKMEQNNQAEKCAVYQDSMAKSQPNHICSQKNTGDCENGILPGSSTIQDMLQPCDGLKGKDGDIAAFSSTKFGSPLQVTPMFSSLTSGIPSPKFSESERQFLLKALGIESPSRNPSNNLTQPPPCKRALLQSL